jgi:hypothetical protein
LIGFNTWVWAQRYAWQNTFKNSSCNLRFEVLNSDSLHNALQLLVRIRSSVATGSPGYECSSYSDAKIWLIWSEDIFISQFMCAHCEIKYCTDEIKHPYATLETCNGGYWVHVVSLHASVFEIWIPQNSYYLLEIWNLNFKIEQLLDWISLIPGQYLYKEVPESLHSWE